MKKLFIPFLFLVTTSACVYPDFGETETIEFSFKNQGKSIYRKILVFAKDSAGNYIDSTVSLNYAGGFTLPGALAFFTTIDVPKIANVSNGVFEVQAPILNGKFLSQEFGVINGIATKRKFIIEIKDSTFSIK